MTRFSEKSFEVRFCAALSAAMMPFNRNPQWFGMTQAQERTTGIDTMLRMKGRLLIFQFKAKQNKKFKLERMQWDCLDRIGRKYPGSAYYVFPEASDVKTAASVKCLLKHSWPVPASTIGKAFRPGADTTTVSLDSKSKALTKKRPGISISAKNACSVFGCFCPPAGTALVFRNSPNDGDLIYFSLSGGPDLERDDLLLPPFLDGIGVVLGAGPEEDESVPPVRSSREFEQILGDYADRDLSPGLYGLFLPLK